MSFIVTKSSESEVELRHG